MARINFRLNCCLYRAFNDADEVIYVGISKQPKARLKDHARYSRWFEFAAKFDFEWFDTRWDALEAERNEIEEHRPVYNIHGNKNYKRKAYKYMPVAA